uniref:fibrosin-1-like protein isoform X3 n=1 Tax=Centroberyx gerrardi TaxID=166262 RepID=UPI003AAF8347
MEGPSRSSGFRQSRRSRSQRDRERRRRRVDLAEQRATSLSSGSEREACGTNSVLGPGGRECRPGFGRHRPPRRRKRESVSCEEDIIDGFAIASFISLEALEMDCSLKPNQRTDMLGRRNKGKRGPEENGGGPLSEPEEGAPPSYSSSCWNKSRNKRRKIDEKGLPLETGYICDTESDSGDKASDNDMDPVFTVSTRKVVEPTPVSMAASMGKSCPPLPARCGGVSRLMVTPRVSGLERSQERSLEPPYPEPVSSSTSSASFSCLPSHSTVTASATVTRANQLNGSSSLHSRHNPSPPLSKHKPFLTFPGRPHSIYSMGISNRNSTSVKPPSSASSAASSSSSMRPPTPSTSMSLSLMRGSGSSGPLRPPSRAGSGALFTSSPGLPPPPPLLQVSTHSTAADQDLLRQNLNSHFLASQEREGRRSVPGAENNAAGAGRSTPGGPSASSSTPGSSGRTSQNQPSIQPLAFQFHQHNHQHQHTHTHQHFTPFLHPTATAPPLFDKYAGKMDGLYRHSFFPQYPPPSVPGIQPVIPPNGPFSSLQGAFQPKGTGPEMTARLGVVPHHLQPKDPRLTDPFGTSLKISNKPGKWCAMHVNVAWMILSHQKKVKMMQADPHKLDFRSELLARLPGAGGLGPLGPLGGAMPPTHDLTRPASLFSATGGVNPSSTPFIPPSTPHSSFLAPTAHLDPYGRSPPFTPLGALGSGAFGGLGSPTLAGGSVFGHKDSPASVVGGLPTPNHHDPWNRHLHGGPSGFPAGPSWAKGADKRDERDRGKEAERRDIPHIKDEKDRDNMLYGRQPVRMSPVAPAFKPRSSTPVSHINGHSSTLGGSSGTIEDLTRSLSRDRDRERDRDGDKRPLPTMSSRGPPLGPSSLVADRDRPRSSSSSVLTTPPPSNPSAPSPLDLYPRPQAPTAHSLHSEPSHSSSQRDNSLPASSSASATVTSLSQGKKSDRTTTPVPKPPLLLPPVKVKEERKEEPEHIPVTLQPHPAPSHSFDRPNSHPHHHSSGTPSSSLSLTPTPGVPIPPPTPHPPSHHHLSMLERSRAIEAYLGSAGAGGLVVGPGGERFTHGPHQGHSQAPHSFTWDPWRELAAHQQQQQQRREAMALRSEHHLALRSEPHLARLLQHQHAQHQHAQRFLEAERAAAVAAAAAAATPHHPQTSTSSASNSAVRQEFGLMAHHFDRPPQLGPPGGGLMDEEQRAQILREDFERARYFGMHQHPHPHPHPHPHLSTGSHLPSPSHAATAAHLEQLHPGLLSHSLPPGAAAASQHHAGLYSRLGPLHPHHVPNGILAKTPAGLVGALSVGAPPPLIPSVTSRSSTPPRSSRLGGPGELALYSAHKDGESR